MDEFIPITEPRQTQRFIRTQLAERGIEPKSKLGQNFLIDLNLLDFIIQAAELTRDDLVLEVGGGTGSLTARLAERAGAVLTVEVDRQLCDIIREMTAHYLNVSVLHADVLRTKNELNPIIFENVHQIHQRFETTRLKLVANLPYSVATPVVANLLQSEWPPNRMLFTVQWELAERLIAQSSSKAYGALSVLVQSLADVAVLRRLPPDVFWPRPQVDSAIVRIQPNPMQRQTIGDVRRFRAFLRDLFAHKRKTLCAALIAHPIAQGNRSAVNHILTLLNLSGQLRAEQLSTEQHLQLFRQFEEMNK